MRHYGIALGYYVDCDTAICANCAPRGFEHGDYSEWPGFEWWESPGAIFIDSESDGPTHCAQCEALIPHDLTAEGLSYISETLAGYLCDGRSACLQAWMDEYGEQVELPEDYMSAFRQGYAHATLWANTRIEDGNPHADYDERPAPEWWQTPNPEWAVQAFDAGGQELIGQECADFVRLCWHDLYGIDPEQAGHDFALTRNGHGAGFWDRGLGARGDQLTHWAKTYGSSTAWCHAKEDPNSDNLAHLD